MPSERVQRRVERFLDESEEALSRNDWDLASARARAVLAIDPQNSDARLYLESAERGRTSASNAAGASTNGPAASGPVSQAFSYAPAPSRTASAPAHPASFAAGRYVVKKFLGEGGKKRVYLAHDEVLDRDVAFALIKTEGLDETARQRVTREAQAMGRLGDHPNIMPIFDLGIEPSPSHQSSPAGRGGAGHPYMVLPLMSGGDVGDVIEKAPDHKVPLDRALEVTKDVCSGLVFAHSKGIVHRDLKPGNVWLTSDGTARIGDFGLAVATDRSRLTREGMMVGTVAYMPPEQAMGGEITPRADLYSMGAMLYEMVTGRPPFLGDDDIAIIGQHINTPPVAPIWHRPDCPKQLDALIMRLLAKDPKQRPESARDVLAALEGVDAVVPSPFEGEGQGVGRTSWTGAQALKQVQGEMAGRSLDSMASGVFVGRQKEMDQLRAVLEESLSGRGRMVTLVGEPGIGKTRTAQELQTYAGLRRCQVLWGRCYEGGGAPPYWPWVQAIRSYVKEHEPEQLRREMGSAVSVIAEVVSDVKERIPNVQPPPQLDSPESARFRLFDSIATFLKTASRSQPLLVILDDLHWSDKPSLLLLEFVARELHDSRVLLVGTYRDVELNRKHPLAVTLGDLTKERLFEKVLLRGLQKDDVARFIELAAGVKPPPGLVEAVHTQTEGNPLFVTEVVRWLVQEGALTRHSEARRAEESGAGTTRHPERRPGEAGAGVEGPRPGDGALRQAQGDGQRAKTWTMPIPEGVRDVIGKRLDRLTPRCNDVLTTAAVIGRRFALPALVRLYSSEPLGGASSPSPSPSPAGRGKFTSSPLEGARVSFTPSPLEGEGRGEGSPKIAPLPAEERLSEDRLLDVLEEALSARIIEELPTGPGRYQFTHALIQETLAKEISTTRKVRLHARIALVLEDLYQDRLEERAAELAEHFAEAETVLGTEKLVRYSLVAGEKAQADFAAEDARAHFEKAQLALSGGPANALMARTLAGLGQAEAMLGERQKGLNRVREAFGIFVGLGDGASAIHTVKEIHSTAGLTGVLDLAERALAIAEPRSVDRGWILTRYCIAVHDEAGGYNEAMAALDSALQIAHEHKDLKLEARAATLVTQRLALHAELKRAVETSSEAIRAIEADGEPFTGLFLFPHVIPAALALGQTARVTELIAMYRQTAESVRYREAIGSLLLMESVQAGLRGHWQISRDKINEAHERSIWVSEHVVAKVLAMVDLQVGNFEDARKRLGPVLSSTEPERTMFGGITSACLALFAHDLTGHPTVSQALDRLSLDKQAIANLQSVRLTATTAQGMATVIQRNAARAQPLYEELRRREAGLDAWAWLATGRVLGRLAKLLGRPDDAESHFQDAIRFCSAAGYQPELAWSLYDLAELANDHSQFGGRDRALKLQVEALAIARELGMKPLIERILRRREILTA